MSCHSTSGGIVSTSLARAVTDLSEKEVQHIFHALKREAQGMASPSEMDVLEWRARQYDLLSRMKRMSDTRRDKLRDRLFRSRSESVPDGPTFHAWRTIEARARQEKALREVSTAVDLAPPGSQAHLYDLGEDGRPKRVWYASYGSNLHRDRFMNYIEGGSPEGSTRVYAGCADKTPPEGDIPIRFAGARPHFALTSRVWRGGIAFIDAQKGESAQGLGRAYDVSISQFDDVVAQENGLDAKYSSPVPLKEALTEGRSVIGNGSYETILHIGDYEGAPVLTFTAPFNTREALTKSGHILRTPVGQTTPIRMPVMTNKPSAAYLRMIGGGLQETFGMDEIAQADYLRGCPGGDRWTRQQMVRILRGEEPDPPREPGPENPKSEHAKSSSSSSNGKSQPKSQPKATKAPAEESKSGALTPTFSHARREDDPAIQAADGAVLAELREKGLFPADTLSKGTRPKSQQRNPGTGSSKRNRKAEAKPSNGGASRPATGASSVSSVRTRRNKGGDAELPKVRTYPTVEEQQVGVARWQKTLELQTATRDSIQRAATSLRSGLEEQQASGAPEGNRLATERNLAEVEKRLHKANGMVAQATDRLNRAKSQRPTRYYTSQNRTLSDWQDEDQRLLDQQRAFESAYEQTKREAQRLDMDPSADSVQQEKAARHVRRVKAQLTEVENRLQETHEIITAIMAKK
jgi:hypothetical protein